MDLLEESEELVERLWDNAAYFKGEMQRLGFDTGRIADAHRAGHAGRRGLAKQFSRALFEAGVFAMAIGFPTVPKGHGAHPGDEHRGAQPQQIWTWAWRPSRSRPKHRRHLNLFRLTLRVPVI